MAASILDLFLGVDLVADVLQPRREFRHVEADRRAAREVEPELLQT